jgi:hypothetical protein
MPQLPLIFLMLAILLAVIPLQAFAEEQAPAIEVLSGAPPRNYPIRVYVYPQAYVTERDQNIFACEWTDQIVSTLYESLRDLRGSILRFIDDHPEYRELALIYFVNVSSPNEADITFKVVSMIAANSTFYGVAYFGGKPVEIAVVCRMADRGRETVYNVVLHEMLHALGLGHAKQKLTGDGAPELMWPGPSTRVKQYPTTLDLYALYVIHFGSTSGDVITIPNGMRYEMVTPYMKEIQTLKQENAKLKDQINTSSMLFERMKQERDALQNKLAEANATIQSQRQQLDSLEDDIIMVKQALRDHDARLASVSQELAAVERFVLNKSAETDYKFRVVAMILQETWLALQGLQNETAAQAGRIAAAERGIASLNLLFILALCFMAAVLATFIYLARRISMLESRVLRGESCLESGGESG